LIGKRCHLQLDCWIDKMKGSHVPFRIPIPCSWIPPRGASGGW
jgi:hypothetical protein